MTSYRRSTRTTPSVREPVQVYLDGGDQDRLERLTSRLGATKSDVLRRGLQALEHQISDPSGHPALRIAGIIDASALGSDDAAREHDRILADVEEASWSEPERG